MYYWHGRQPVWGRYDRLYNGVNLVRACSRINRFVFVHVIGLGGTEDGGAFGLFKEPDEMPLFISSFHSDLKRYSCVQHASNEKLGAACERLCLSTTTQNVLLCFCYCATKLLTHNFGCGFIFFIDMLSSYWSQVGQCVMDESASAQAWLVLIQQSIPRCCLGEPSSWVTSACTTSIDKPVSTFFFRSDLVNPISSPLCAAEQYQMFSSRKEEKKLNHVQISVSDPGH